MASPQEAELNVATPAAQLYLFSCSKPNASQHTVIPPKPKTFGHCSLCPLRFGRQHENCTLCPKPENFKPQPLGAQTPLKQQLPINRSPGSSQSSGSQSSGQEGVAFKDMRLAKDVGFRKSRDLRQQNSSQRRQHHCQHRLVISIVIIL